MLGAGYDLPRIAAAFAQLGDEGIKVASGTGKSGLERRNLQRLRLIRHFDAPADSLLAETVGSDLGLVRKGAALVQQRMSPKHMYLISR